MFINGHIVVKRTIKERGWYHDPNTLSVWVHLMVDANFKDSEWDGTIVKRGEVVSSLSDLARDCNLSMQEVRTAMRKLGAYGEVLSRRVGRTSIITLCHYDSYQCVQQDSNTPPTQQQQDNNTIATRDQHDILEEGNKGKTEERKKKRDAAKALAEAAERLYNLYPSSVIRTEGKRASLKSPVDKEKLKRLLATHTEEQLAETIKKYLAEGHGPYTKMFSTLLNNLPDYSDTAESVLFSETPAQPKKPSPVSGFKISSGGLLDGIEY